MSTRSRDMIVRWYEAWHARARVDPIVPCLVAMSFVLLFAIDPFGLEEASHSRSEQATLRVTSPWYEPSGQVTAVVIDDAFIRKRNAGWPLSYGDQGRLIRSLLAAKPAVLVIDLVYPHRHASAALTAAQVETAASAPPADSIKQLFKPIIEPGNDDDGNPIVNPPVVFTAMAREPGQLDTGFRFCPEETEPNGGSLLDPDSIQPELRSLLDQPKYLKGDPLLRLALVRWSGCGNCYPLVLGGRSTSPTPAFAAFRAYCHAHSKEKLAACSDDPSSASADSYLQPMIVRSGAFPPATQAFAYGDKACQGFARQAAAGEKDFVSWWRKLWVSVQQASLGLFGDLRTDPKPALSLPCPAVTVVPLSLLDTASVEDLNTLFAGKAVLIGANLSGIPDSVASQVHGQIPGVVWHAMALDNLISLGSGYLAERHDKLQIAFEVFLVVLFAFLFPFIMGWLEMSAWKTTLAALSFGVWCALALMEAIAGHWVTALLALGIGIVLDFTKPTTSAGYLLAVLIAAGCSVWSLEAGWPPGNWFGLVIVVIGFVHTIKPYYRGEERKHFPHSASLLGALYKTLSGGIRS